MDQKSFVENFLLCTKNISCPWSIIVCIAKNHCEWYEVTKAERKKHEEDELPYWGLV